MYFDISISKLSNGTTNTFSKQGLAGPKGDRGEKGDKGDAGPEYQGDDLPDFTLIFDNKLI